MSAFRPNPRYNTYICQFLASESLFHWSSSQFEAYSGTGLPTTRRKHLPFYDCPLPSFRELRQPDGRLEATTASLPLT